MCLSGKQLTQEHTLTTALLLHTEWLHLGLRERPLQSMLLLSCLPDTYYNSASAEPCYNTFLQMLNQVGD